MSTRTKMLGGRNPTMFAFGKSVRRSKLRVWPELPMERIYTLDFIVFRNQRRFGQ
jgi:hypothetical protein